MYHCILFCEQHRLCNRQRAWLKASSWINTGLTCQSSAVLDLENVISSSNDYSKFWFKSSFRLWLAIRHTNTNGLWLVQTVTRLTPKWVRKRRVAKSGESASLPVVEWRSYPEQKDNARPSRVAPRARTGAQTSRLDTGSPVDKLDAANGVQDIGCAFSDSSRRRTPSDVLTGLSRTTSHGGVLVVLDSVGCSGNGGDSASASETV